MSQEEPKQEEPKQEVQEVMQITLADGTQLPRIIPQDLRVLIWPDACLRKPCEPTRLETIKQEDFRAIIAHMILTMYKLEGIGLAANQVGLKYSCFVWDTKWVQDKATEISPNVIFNPVLVDSYDEYMSGEGCLSCPGVSVPVKRGQFAEIKGLDIHGQEITLVGEGLEAACFQHECDHLNGIAIVNHMSSIKRDIYRRKSLKYRKQIQRMEKHDSRSNYLHQR